MFFKIRCVLVLWTKVALALEGLNVIGIKGQRLCMLQALFSNLVSKIVRLE